MDAKSSPPSGRRGRPWEVRPWTLVAFGLLMTATLIQACSDNDGTSGPRFAGGPAATTGFANTAGDIVVQLGINPNSITPGQRAGVTAFVTNRNGQPLGGKRVQFSTSVGSLDTTVGTTNSAGQFSTFLRVSSTDAANTPGGIATVTAFVEGAIGTGTVNFGANVELVLIPDATTQSVAATIGNLCPSGSLGGFRVNFTVTGGVPPYTFRTAGGGTITSGGIYTASVVGGGPFATGFFTQDVVTVIDSRGAQDTSTVRIECVTPG
jgi:hypothetical protein